jgi:hypothetical protein
VTDGYDLWDRTQEVGQRVADAYARLLGAGSGPARVAAAADFVRAVRARLARRLLAGAGARRRAFPRSVPAAGRETVAALWAEVFWAARAQTADDDSGELEATDVSIRRLLALEPADLSRSEAVRAWGRRLAAVERTFAGLEVQAQAALEARREAY